MVSTLERPACAANYAAHMDLVNAEHGCDALVRQKAVEPADGFYFPTGQFGAGVVFTKLVGAMQQSVGVIFAACLPRQMPLVDAVPMSAAMRRIGMLWRGWRSSIARTKEIVDPLDFAFEIDLPVAVAIQRIGPKQALITFISVSSLKIFLNVTRFCHALAYTDTCTKASLIYGGKSSG